MDPERPFGHLLARARRGDRDALNELSRRFYPPVRTYVSQRMGQRARRWGDSGGIANHVLEEVLRSVHRMPSRATEADVLRRMKRTAFSRIIDHVRSHRRDVGESGQDLLRDSSTGADTTLRNVTSADVLRWMEEKVDHLPPLYREVVRLHLMQGLPLVEVSQTLGLAEETARKRFTRGCRALALRIPRRELDAYLR